MGLKKRGLKAGCWNGFGGKLEQDETPLECIVRETEEEAGIKLDEAREIGICKFHNYGFKYTIQVHFLDLNLIRESWYQLTRWSQNGSILIRFHMTICGLVIFIYFRW